MKPIFLFISLLLLQATQAQLKVSTQNQCATFTVDILDGKVNGLDLKASVGEIKKTLPCFTSEVVEGTPAAKCGEVISYKNQDVYFYTTRHYVEIRDKFKGKLSVPLMGATRNSTFLFKWLGNVKLKDTDWDAYNTSYGILILYYNKLKKVNKIQFSSDGTETINLCQ